MFAPFMRDAWIAATIVAALAGIVGFFVVLRGDAFPAHALPLGTFPGAALAALVGWRPVWGLLLFAALGVAGVSWLGRRGRPEIATALSLVALLGMGALFLNLSGRYAQATYGLLFGEVLGVGSAELVPLAWVSLAAVLLVALLFRPLLLSSIAPELAEARGVSPVRMEFAFLAILALATAMALPVVGALLVFSLMVGPASAARAVAGGPGAGIAVSVALAVAMVWASIALAFMTDWPVGFFIGALAALAYVGGRCAMPMRST